MGRRYVAQELAVVSRALDGVRLFADLYADPRYLPNESAVTFGQSVSATVAILRDRVRTLEGLLRDSIQTSVASEGSRKSTLATDDRIGLGAVGYDPIEIRNREQTDNGDPPAPRLAILPGIRKKETST